MCLSVQIRFFITLVFLLSTFSRQAKGKLFNVLDFGAVGDARTDDSKAFLDAWRSVCEATTTSGATMPTLQVPAGKTFLLKQVKFSGPCKSATVQIQMMGNIIAPMSTDWTDCKSGCWLCFDLVDNLIISGTATINGNGAVWWQKSTHVLYFQSCNNLRVSGLTSHNSPLNHIGISGCKGVSISKINLIAPNDSPNTDGIDIANSNQLDISDSFIGTGDDCIAINGGSSNIKITRLNCGPGHGISVGSLGKDGSNDMVEEVHVRNCTFNGTQNGARIKTWAGGLGFARSISYEDIILIRAGNPIFIDQHYCPHQNCPPEKQTAVKVSDVTFSKFQGTSADNIAITLNCSSIVPCTNIKMNLVNITSLYPSSKVEAICNHADGTATSTAPVVPCLSSVQDVLIRREGQTQDGDQEPQYNEL
ncbi:hypothetical protein SLE2022_088400 [Rubroshorea leprosula]